MNQLSIAATARSTGAAIKIELMILVDPQMKITRSKQMRSVLNY